MNFVKDMRQFAKAFLLGSGINLLLYFLGSRYLGKEGCALASLLTNIGITIYIFHASQKLVFIPYDFLKGGLIFLSCIAIALIAKIFIFSSLSVEIVFKSILYLLLIIVLFFINKSDINEILQKFRLNYKRQG